MLVVEHGLNLLVPSTLQHERDDQNKAIATALLFLRLFMSIIEPATHRTGSGAQHSAVERLPGCQSTNQCTRRGTNPRARQAALLA
jgi:hypothetical protein